MEASPIGGAPRPRPRGTKSAVAARRAKAAKTAKTAKTTGSLGGLESLLDLQARAGNAAVVQFLRAGVQRDGPTDTKAPPQKTPAEDAKKALAEQLALIEDEIIANELDDPKEAARQERALLLAQFTHPDPFPDRAAVMEFIARCDRDAEKESVALAKLGKDSAQAFVQHPQAFPETWADKLAKTLDIGVDEQSLVSERARSWAHLEQVAARVPAGVSEYGLPVSLAEIRALKAFVLRPDHAKLGEADVVRDFAQAALGYRGSAVRAEIVRWWKRMLSSLVDNVRSGTEIIDPDEIATITKTKGKFSEFVNSTMAPGEDQFRELDASVANLHELVMLTAIISVASGLHASAQMWTEATRLLDAKLAEADAIVAGWGVAETLKHAFLWMIDRGYVGDQLLLMVRVLVDNLPEVLKKIAMFMGLQAIPGVDVLVDLYLLWELGKDLVTALWDLGVAFKDASTAKTVLELQKGSASLVAALATAPLRIVMDYLGLGATLRHLQSRVAKLLAENPGMTTRQAAKIAVREPEPSPGAGPGPGSGPAPAKKSGKTSAKDAPEGCFVAGVSVLTADGLRPIEELRVGDLLVATDPGHARQELCRVSDVTTFADRPVLRLRFAGEADDGVECTAQHPFWVEGEGWLAAGDVRPGMAVRTAGGSSVAVTEVTRTGRRTTVHNLTVDGLHTYHVSRPALLVHNKPVRARERSAALAAVQDALEQRLIAQRARSRRINEQAEQIQRNRPEREELVRRSEQLRERLEGLQDDIHDATTPAEVTRILEPEANRAIADLTALQAEVNAAWVPRPTVAETAVIDRYTQTFADLRATYDSGNLTARRNYQAALDRMEAAARSTQNRPGSTTSRLQDHLESMMNQRRLLEGGGALAVFGQRLPCQATAAAGGPLRGLNYFEIERRLGIPVREGGSAAPGASGGVRLVWRYPDGSQIHIDIPGSLNESTWQISREAHAGMTAATPNKGVHLSQEGIAVPDRSAPAHMPIVRDRLLERRLAGDMRP